jgi:hypothetical protein
VFFTVVFGIYSTNNTINTIIIDASGGNMIIVRSISCSINCIVTWDANNGKTHVTYVTITVSVVFTVAVTEFNGIDVTNAMVIVIITYASRNINTLDVCITIFCIVTVFITVICGLRIRFLNNGSTGIKFSIKPRFFFNLETIIIIIYN